MNPAVFLPRVAAPTVQRQLAVFPVAVVTGARQTGKSTLVRQPHIVGERSYLTLDDLLIRERARHDPEALLEQPGLLVLDEVQHAPDLLLAIKRRVDERWRPGQYILTGSANLLVHRRVSESLAGRAGYVTLWPMTRREQLGTGTAGRWAELLARPSSEWLDLLSVGEMADEPWQALARRGGYPIPAHALADPADRAVWFDGYTMTYLERDIQQLSSIEYTADMLRLMRALCLRIGGLLNQAEVSRDIALPVSTVQRYLNLLEVSYQLVRVPAYAVNRTKRLVKSPKIYWSDTGLAMHVAGEHEPRGAHLENVVLTDLLAWASTMIPRAQILHWRTSKGAEVDLVVETPDRLLPIEVKATERPRPADARHLRTFLDEYPDLTDGALLVHAGPETHWLERGILAVPWSCVV